VVVETGTLESRVLAALRPNGNCSLLPLMATPWQRVLFWETVQELCGQFPAMPAAGVPRHSLLRVQTGRFQLRSVVPNGGGIMRSFDFQLSRRQRRS
jgi:hypothetical protein